jgi:hypothetical protein
MAKHKTAEQPKEIAPETATAAAPASERDPGLRRDGDQPAERAKTAFPDPFAIAVDNAAGVRLFESRRDRQMAIQFGEGKPEDRPAQEVIDRLKEHGFRWNGLDKIWAKPVRPGDAMQTRIEAERLFQEVSNMQREAKGLAAEKTPC